MASGPTLEVQAPTRAPREGGLFAAVEVRPNDRLAHIEAVVFQGDPNVLPSAEESRCLATAPVANKTFGGVSTDQGIGAPFTLYAGVVCFAAPESDEVEKARAVLEAGRERVLEQRLATWAAGGTGLAAGANARAAVGRVEQAIDAGYVGRGVILMSRFDAVSAGLEYVEGELPRTVNGTPVVASGVIAEGTVYGVGAVVVEHGDIVERDVLAHLQNRHYALAEQVHALLVDAEFRVRASITG